MCWLRSSRCGLARGDLRSPRARRPRGSSGLRGHDHLRSRRSMTTFTRNLPRTDALTAPPRSPATATTWTSWATGHARHDAAILWLEGLDNGARLNWVGAGKEVTTMPWSWATSLTGTPGTSWLPIPSTMYGDAKIMVYESTRPPTVTWAWPTKPCTPTRCGPWSTTTWRGWWNMLELRRDERRGQPQSRRAGHRRR